MANTSEPPAHKVYLDAYWIYKTPVTVAQYTKLVTSDHDMPDELDMSLQPNYPVVFVSWNDASADAAWAGEMLPHEGHNGRRRLEGPTGEIIRGGTSDWDQTKTEVGSSIGLGALVLVAGLNWTSPYGALDMEAVWQRRTDWDYGYDSSPPDSNPVGPVSGFVRMRRAGTLIDGQYSERVACRDSNDPDARTRPVGFRLVYEPVQQ